MENNELYHHGIRGMKWGVRRYQNPDGSLTNAGQKRRSLGQVIKDHKVAKKRKQALEKARAAKVEKAKHMEKAVSGKLSPKDMTDEELITSIRRSQLEQQYKMLNPEEVSSGKKFATTVLDKVVAPAAIGAGQQFLRKSLDKLGDNLLKDVADPDDINTLRKTYEKLDLKNKIDKLKNPTESLDDTIKRLENEKKYKDLMADYNDLERENRNFNARQKYNENHASTETKTTETKTSETKTSDNKKNNEPEILSGDVEWTDRSKSSKYQEKGSSYVNGNFKEVKISGVPAVYESKGRSYFDDFYSDLNEIPISGLLEDKRK